MEKIIIKELKQFPMGKGQGLSVVYNDNLKATVAYWHTQEQSYLMNDVGVGGSVECDVIQKGQYMNIENVNFESAVKGNAQPVQEKVLDEVKTTLGKAADLSLPNPQRVGLYIKLAVEMMIAQGRNGDVVTEETLCECVQEIKKLEEFTIGLLSQ